MIEFKNVSFSYGDCPVLSGADFEIGLGLTLLIGPNGCGKSTLLRLAAGVEMPDSGRICVGGFDLWQEEVQARAGLCYLPEHPDLTPYATIGEILDLVCRLRNQPIDAAQEALQRAGLDRMRNFTIRELSLGQRRRALFAACLVGDPRVILLDEPLEGMDLKMQHHIIGWVGEQVQSGKSLWVSSHVLSPFAETAVRAVSIREGRVRLFSELPEAPDSRTDFLERIACGEEPAPPSERGVENRT